VSVPKLETANLVLGSFDELKVSHMELCELVEKKLLSSTAEELKLYADLTKKSEEIKNELIKNRGDYLSYNVVLPYISKANQLHFLYINTGNFITRKNNEQLKKAAYCLQTISKNDMIYESHQVIRQYFTETYGVIKNAGDKSVAEELKAANVIQTDLEKENRLGELRWWVLR
jgi:hypothetical protein